MAAPVLPSFVVHYVYPAVLTGLGVFENYSALGGQITALSKEIKKEIKGVRDEIKEVRDEMKDQETRQTRLKHDMTSTEKILKDCGKDK